MTRAHVPVVDRARRHHRALAVVMATMLVPFVVGSAAAKTTPIVTVAPTVTFANVSVQVDVDQSSNQVASCTYVLDANAVASCGTNVPNGKQASRYTISLTSQATGGHTIIVTVVLNGKGTGSGSTTFTIAPPGLLAVAFTDMNGDHLYDAGDILIIALLDSSEDGVPGAGDTVVADQYPLDCSGSSFGNFGVTSLAVTSAQATNGTVVAVAGGTTFTWLPVGTAPNGPGVESVVWNIGGIEFIGQNHFVQDDTTSQQPSDGMYVPAADNVLVPDAPIDPFINCFDGTDNSFVDIQLDPS